MPGVCHDRVTSAWKSPSCVVYVSLSGLYGGSTKVTPAVLLSAGGRISDDCCQAGVKLKV